MSPKCISIYLRFNPQARESLIYAAAIRCSFTASFNPQARESLIVTIGTWYGYRWGFNPQARESLISTALTAAKGIVAFQSAGSREPDRNRL